MIYLILISRLLDTFTTLLNVNKWGVEVEGNGFIQNILLRGNWVFFLYELLMALLLIYVYGLGNRSINLGIKIFVIVSFIISITNLGCYIFIK